MALGAARIDERFAGLGNKLPVVAARMQSELQYAEGVGIAYFAVGDDGADGPLIFSPGAHHKLSNPARGIGRAIRVLRRKAFVIVIVAGDNHVGIGIVKRLPQRLDAHIVAMSAAGTEERLMPVRQRARSRMRGYIPT